MTELTTLILTIIGTGIGVIGLTYAILRNFKSDIHSELLELKDDIKDLKNDMKDVDRRLCRMEGAFSSKDCCILKSSNDQKEAK